MRADYPFSKSLLQLAVNLSVLLSSYHTAPTSTIHTMPPPLTHGHYFLLPRYSRLSLSLLSLTNFMRRYSKLPSPHHICLVTINLMLGVCVCGTQSLLLRKGYEKGHEASVLVSDGSLCAQT